MDVEADGRTDGAGESRRSAETPPANAAARMVTRPASKLGGRTHRGRARTVRWLVARERRRAVSLEELLPERKRQQFLRLAVGQSGSYNERSDNEEDCNLLKRSVISTATRLLTFRLTQEEFSELRTGHLLFGLICTWIVGIGRWWDDPRANLLQHLGAGSLIYIFVLALLLWLVIWPLRPKSWSYVHVLTFISLTSPPAILYAIPVEKLTSLEKARELNVWFLAIVASWRVALLFFYLSRHAKLAASSIIVAALLPITLIVVTLTILNLERAVFNVMGGLRESGTANDSAYGVLFLLANLSMLLFIPLLVCYVTLIVKAYSNRGNKNS